MGCSGQINIWCVPVMSSTGGKYTKTYWSVLNTDIILNICADKTSERNSIRVQFIGWFDLSETHNTNVDCIFTVLITMVPQAYKASICNKPECQFLLAAWWTVDGCKNRISDKNFCSKNVNLPRSLFINVCRILLPPKYFLSIFITKMKSVRYYQI